MSIAQVDVLARDERIADNIEVAKAQLHISTELIPCEIFCFGPLSAKEGVEGIIDELRCIYSRTKISCDGCGKPIPEENKSFIDEQADLDEIYYCALCRVAKLRKCNNKDMIDWSICTAVERDSERVSGVWVFRGTRVPVSALFENLEDGSNAEEFVNWFPGVTIEQVREVLEHVARSAAA